jgi:tyrocidine synthetase-3
MATEKEQGLDILLAYKTDLFNASTIRVLLRQYQTLLAHIVAGPAQQLSALPLLTENEQLYWTQTWNNSTVDYPQNRCIQALFEQQVLQTPEAIALQFGSERLTYRQLNERANQLAHTLRKMGIAPGVLVGLYMEHSIETIIGLMGVLKAGGAYVPLDPAHPAGQLVFMLGDADISLLLTQQHLASYFTAADIDMLCLDSQWDRVAEAPVDNPTPLAQSQDLVYVIYTSGSTGRPKGVKIQHTNLVNYIWWASQVYLQGENLSFPLYSSLSFDLTATSIFTPLITGNKIVIYRIQGWEIANIINDNQVDILKVTPSHLALIKDNKLDDSRIKRLIIGGEALETELARQIHDDFGQQVEIFNEYGPTEATVGCMIYRFDPAMDQRAFVPIGKPAANMHIYILDEQLAPVAENVTGELYIAGAGLAAGYWRRPELTDERFVNNPFVPGTKMYKTGDMARMLATGNIEFIGRQDEQVKFRGYRVELNAIRSELKRHSDIRDSVVLVDKDQKGHDVMVAYYVSRQALDAVDLRTFLARHVIEETIPNIFIHLKRLPLTLNGKVDYRGLPPWREVRQQAHGQYVAPRNPAEEILADIWTQVLEIEQIGIHDNFFALGGHSLLATQVISRIRTQFQVDLPLRTLFEAPTIAEMVAAVLHRQAEQVDSSLLAEMLSDLDELTEEELQTLLTAEGQFPDGTD